MAQPHRMSWNWWKQAVCQASASPPGGVGRAGQQRGQRRDGLGSEQVVLGGAVEPLDVAVAGVAALEHGIEFAAHDRQPQVIARSRRAVLRMMAFQLGQRGVVETGGGAHADARQEGLAIQPERGLDVTRSAAAAVVAHADTRTGPRWVPLGLREGDGRARDV